MTQKIHFTQAEIKALQDELYAFGVEPRPSCNFTPCYHLHPFVPNIFCSLGVIHLANRADAEWLIKEIAYAQVDDWRVWGIGYQNWSVTHEDDDTPVLRCQNGDRYFFRGRNDLFRCQDEGGPVVLSKRISNRYFPLPKIALVYANCALLLVNEHEG